jgi:hypothetical protein
MSNGRKEWTPETVPDSFWNRIEAAHGNADRFAELLADVPQDELKDIYWQYYDLAELLLSREHRAYMENTGEDAVMDLSNWIVSQGRKFYLDVYEHPEKTPPRPPSTIMSFLSALILTYSHRFDDEIDE